MLYSYSLRFNISIVLPIQTILFCHFHMYRRFRHPKFLRRLPHRSFLLNNKIGNFYSTLFDIIFQGKSPEISAFYNLCKIVPGHAPILRRHYFIFYTSSYILFSASHISQMRPDRPRSHPARCKGSPTCPADPYMDISYSFPAGSHPVGSFRPLPENHRVRFLSGIHFPHYLPTDIFQ